MAASIQGLRCEYDVSDEAFMVLELNRAALQDCSETVQYRPEFKVCESRSLNNNLNECFMTVSVHFLPDDVTIEAAVGEPFLEVANRAGVAIPVGCLMGSCHACEVELDDGRSICSCISSIPLGRSHLTVTLFSDPTW